LEQAKTQKPTKLKDSNESSPIDEHKEKIESNSSNNTNDYHKGGERKPKYGYKESSPPTTQPNTQQQTQTQQQQPQIQPQPSVNIPQQDPLLQTQQSNTTDNSNFVSNDGRGGYRGRGGRGAISTKPRGSSFSTRGSYRGNSNRGAFVSRYPNPQYYVPQQQMYTPYNPYQMNYGIDDLVYFFETKTSILFFHSKSAERSLFALSNGC